MSLCPQCFRDVNKSPLSFLCPDCELKATIGKEAEATRRLMREQERRQQKIESMKAQEEYLQKLKAERRSRPRASSPEEETVNLELLLIKPQELRDFNNRASKALANNDLKNLKKCFNSAQKWSYEDVLVCENELWKASKSPAIGAFLTALNQHKTIRNAMVFTLRSQNMIKDLDSDVRSWLYLSCSDEHADALMKFLKKETEICDDFIDNYPWFSLSTENLENALLEMMLKENIDRWHRACRDIFDHLINANMIKQIKYVPTLLLLARRAVEEGHHDKSLFALTRLAAQSQEYMDMLKAFKLDETLSKIIDEKEPQSLEDTFQAYRRFFEEWRSYTKDDKVLGYIAEVEEEVRSLFKKEFQERIYRKNNLLSEKIKELQTCSKEEAINLQKKYQNSPFYLRYGGITYKQLVIASPEELEKIFDYVLKNQSRVKTCVTAPSTFFGLLNVFLFILNIFESLIGLYDETDYYQWSKTIYKRSSLFYLLGATIFACSAWYLGRSSFWTMTVISSWYSFKWLLISRAAYALRNMEKIEEMSFKSHTISWEIETLKAESSALLEFWEQSFDEKKAALAA